MKNREDEGDHGAAQAYGGNLQDAIRDDFSRNNFNELRSDLDADAVSRNSIYNSRSNTGGGQQNSKKMKATSRKKSTNKSVSNTRGQVAKPGGARQAFAENSRMESVMSKHNHTCR